MANTTLTGFDAIPAVASEDLLAVVDDPSGSPALRKATVTQLETHLDQNMTVRLSAIPAVIAAADEIVVIDDVPSTNTATTATFANVASFLDQDVTVRLSAISPAIVPADELMVIDNVPATNTAVTVSFANVASFLDSDVTVRLSAISAIADADEMMVIDDVPATNTATTATFTQLNTYLNGSLSGKKSRWIPVKDMTLAATLPPASATIETTTNKIATPVFDFSGSADEFVHFNMVFGEAWNLGTVTFRAVWLSTAVDTDTTIWALQGVSIADNVLHDTAYGSVGIISDAAQGAADEIYISDESAAVTIAGTPADNGLVEFRLSRDADTDTMTEDSRLIGIKLYYTEDTLTDA